MVADAKAVWVVLVGLGAREDLMGTQEEAVVQAALVDLMVGIWVAEAMEVEGEEEVIQTDLLEYPGQRRWGLSQRLFSLRFFSDVFWHFQRKTTTK